MEWHLGRSTLHENARKVSGLARKLGVANIRGQNWSLTTTQAEFWFYVNPGFRDRPDLYMGNPFRVSVPIDHPNQWQYLILPASGNYYSPYLMEAPEASSGVIHSS